MNEDEIHYALKDLQEFLGSQLEEAAKRIEGVPRDVREVMMRALLGSLDFVMHDIHPEGEGPPNFFDLIPEFHHSVGMALTDGLSKFDWTNE